MSIMNLFLRHSFYRTLTLSRLLNSLGSHIYNLVFIIYAASLPFKTAAVFMANLILVLPTVFSFWVGVKADRSQHKGKLIIGTGFLQALLFTGVALLIKDKNFFVFSIICLINIVSDLLSDFAGGLRMPIMQHNLDQEDLYEAYSFTQFLTYMSMLAGQALGVWLLTVSENNFGLVAIINALSFLLSSSILWLNKEKLTHKKVEIPTEKTSLLQDFKNLYQEMSAIFKNHDNSSFLRVLLGILVINALGGSITAIYNFHLLEQDFFGLSYGQLVLMVQVISILGAIIGSLTPNDYFGKKSLGTLLVVNALAFIGVGISNLLNLNLLFGLVCLALAAYIVGKAMPKMDALLMANLPADKLAQSNSFLSTVFTFSVPLGTALFSSLALYNLLACWICFAVLAVLALTLAGGKL